MDYELLTVQSSRNRTDSESSSTSSYHSSYSPDVQQDAAAVQGQQSEFLELQTEFSNLKEHHNSINMSLRDIKDCSTLEDANEKIMELLEDFQNRGQNTPLILQKDASTDSRDGNYLQNLLELTELDASDIDSRDHMQNIVLELKAKLQQKEKEIQALNSLLGGGASRVEKSDSSAQTDADWLDKSDQLLAENEMLKSKLSASAKLYETAADDESDLSFVHVHKTSDVIQEFDLERDQRKIEELEKKSIKVKEEFDECKLQHKDVLQDLEKQLEDAQQRERQEKKSRKDLEKTNQELMLEQRRMQEHFNTEIQNLQLMDQSENYQQRIEEIQQNLDEKEAELQSVRRCDFENQLKSAQGELLNVQKENEALQQKYRSDFQQTQKQLEQEAQRNQELVLEQSQIKDKSENYQSKMEEFQKKLEEKEAEEQAKEKLQTTLINDLQKQLKCAQEDWSKAQKYLQNELASANSEKEDLRQKINISREQVAQVQNEYAALEKYLQNELASANSEKEDLRQKINISREQVAQVQSEYEALQARYSDDFDQMEKQLQQTQNLVKMAKQSEIAMAKQNQELMQEKENELKEKLEADLQTIQDNFAKKEEKIQLQFNLELQNLSKKLEESQQERKQITQQMQQLENYRLESARELQNLREQNQLLENEKKQYKNNVEELLEENQRLLSNIQTNGNSDATSFYRGPARPRREKVSRGRSSEQDKQECSICGKYFTKDELTDHFTQCLNS